MRCRECESILWMYLDYELPEGQRGTVAAHLEGCPRCAQAFDQLRAFPLQTAHLQIVPPPPDFTMRLMQRIGPLPAPREFAVQQRRGTSWQGPLGMAVAFSSAAAAIILGLLSTVALALASGQRLPVKSGSSASSIANAIGAGIAVAFWQHLSWTIIFALVGMIATLAVLWFRVVAPRH